MEFIVPVEKVPRLFLVTDSKWNTDEHQWGNNVGNIADGENLTEGMCKVDPQKWLFAYTHHIIAALMSPYNDGVLWECDGVVKHMDACKRVYCVGLTTTKTARTPVLGRETRIKLGFTCVQAVYKNERFLGWMTDWLSGQDRSPEKAKDIAESCYDNIARDKDGHMGAKGRAAFAAQWMCWSCNIMVAEPNDKKNTLQKWVIRAIFEAIYSAWMDGNKLDLIKVAETVMAAR